MIDRKYKFVAVNPCNGHVHTEEDALILTAADMAIVPALTAYIRACKSLRCGPEHIESMELLRGRVIKYQEEKESRVPDTDSPCEIDRCIGGDVYPV